MKKSTFLIILIVDLLLSSCSQNGGNTDSSNPLPEVSAVELPEDISKADISNMDFSFTDRDKNQNSTNSKILTPEEVEQRMKEIAAEDTARIANPIVEE